MMIARLTSHDQYTTPYGSALILTLNPPLQENITMLRMTVPPKSSSSIEDLMFYMSRMQDMWY